MSNEQSQKQRLEALLARIEEAKLKAQATHAKLLAMKQGRSSHVA